MVRFSFLSFDPCIVIVTADMLPPLLVLSLISDANLMSVEVDLYMRDPLQFKIAWGKTYANCLVDYLLIKG